jgi:pimeloyl-ACP methyl ester carboxylesterase
MRSATIGTSSRAVEIPLGRVKLDGDLEIPVAAVGVVLFAHGSGSSRQSPRNQFVARVLRERKLGTLLFDLLTPREEVADAISGHLRFDIDLLAQRLAAATRWLAEELPDVPAIGYFGASTGGAAALAAAAELGPAIAAVVSRGGRPDLAGPALARVRAPTLLIVGSRDGHVLELNRGALGQLRCEKRLHVVEGATHLFEEPGALDEVAGEASAWLREHMEGVQRKGAGP